MCYMWWWRKIRRATIPQEDRDLFESLGETVIALMLTSGYGPSLDELRSVYYNKETLAKAVPWLTERSDLRERREDRVETVEWAVLVFVVLGVVADFALVASRLW
jgi:hypothetical protein